MAAATTQVAVAEKPGKIYQIRADAARRRAAFFKSWWCSIISPSIPWRIAAFGMDGGPGPSLFALNSGIGPTPLW